MLSRDSRLTGSSLRLGEGAPPITRFMTPGELDTTPLLPGNPAGGVDTIMEAGLDIVPGEFAAGAIIMGLTSLLTSAGEALLLLRLAAADFAGTLGGMAVDVSIWSEARGVFFFSKAV